MYGSRWKQHVCVIFTSFSLLTCSMQFESSQIIMWMVDLHEYPMLYLVYNVGYMSLVVRVYIILFLF